MRTVMLPASNVPSLSVLTDMVRPETATQDQIITLFVQAPCGRDQSFLTYIQGVSECRADDTHAFTCTMQYLDPEQDVSTPTYYMWCTVQVTYDPTGEPINAYVVKQGIRNPGTFWLFADTLVAGVPVAVGA